MAEENETKNQPEVEEDKILDQTLRPKRLGDYVGQDQIKKNLKIFLAAGKKRNEPLEHVLLYGPAGLGKTTLANIIAGESGVNIRTTSGPALERAGDLAAILTNLEESDILFIDEIHRIKTNVEEILYSAMEDYALDIIIGKGPATRSMRINLPKFTLIGATTKAGSLSSPLRDRFGHIYKLDFYTEEEMQAIIKRSAAILDMNIEEEAIKEIARCSRKTPRIANRLLKRVRDFAEVESIDSINHELTKNSLKTIGVDVVGLDRTDRKILLTIIEKFNGGPVGLNTIAAATAEETETIEDIYEPYLMQIGFLDRTNRGRVVTPHAYSHLQIEYIQKQENLF